MTEHWHTCSTGTWTTPVTFPIRIECFLCFCTSLLDSLSILEREGRGERGRGERGEGRGERGEGGGGRGEGGEEREDRKDRKEREGRREGQRKDEGEITR